MVGMGILFGFVMLLAGILIMVGFISKVGIWLALGFLLLGACCLFGVQPGFLAKSRE